MIDIRVKELPTAAVAYVQGDADAANSIQLLRNLTDLLEARPPRLIVVMDEVRYIDSRGLGALVGAYHRAKEKHCVLCLVSANPNIRRVLQVTGLNRVMTLWPTEGEALLPEG